MTWSTLLLINVFKKRLQRKLLTQILQLWWQRMLEESNILWFSCLSYLDTFPFS